MGRSYSTLAAALAPETWLLDEVHRRLKPCIVDDDDAKRRNGGNPYADWLHAFYVRGYWFKKVGKIYADQKMEESRVKMLTAFEQSAALILQFHESIAID